MSPKILYIMSSYNIYGGTPKKTLDLMKHFGNKSVLYVYDNSYNEFKPQFEITGGKVYEGFYGRNIIKHLNNLLRIIDQEQINIVQTQFSWGETLGFLIKIFRPKIRLIVAFVGPFKPSSIKKYLLSLIYNFVDSFVYITKYVQKEKQKQFPVLKRKYGKIIYNGTEKRIDNGKNCQIIKNFSVLDIAGLIDLKNIQILIHAFNILVNNLKKNDLFLYVAGDGPYRNQLESLIESYSLHNHIFLIGYQLNVGKLLNDCDIFVHPSYAEGFGIVVTEAMMAEKPIIVANAGALPEIIEHEKTGLIVDPHDANQWAEAILKIAENPAFASELAHNAKTKAEKEFTAEKFVTNYEKLYQSLLNS